METMHYHRPASVADAVKLAGQHGDDKILAGGQSTLPSMRLGLLSPTGWIDLAGITELQGVCIDGSNVVIGAMTTHAAVAASKDVQSRIPALAQLAGGIGDRQVRNRGTIGGSLANNDPAACYPAAVLGLGATIQTDRRKIAADDYFQGLFSTALEEGEFVTSVIFPIPQKAAYVKFNQPASRFALTGVFVAKFPNGVRVAVTGAGNDGVFRWAEAERALSADFSASALSGLKVDASGMNADLHGSAAYRANLVKVLTGRAVTAAG